MAEDLLFSPSILFFTCIVKGSSPEVERLSRDQFHPDVFQVRPSALHLRRCLDQEPSVSHRPYGRLLSLFYRSVVGKNLRISMFKNMCWHFKVKSRSFETVFIVCVLEGM